MTLNLYVLQHQWIVATLLSGGALLLLFCLSYFPLWQPREEGKGEAVPGRGSGFVRYLPWTLAILVITCVSFAVVTFVAKSCRPPNW